MVSSNLSQQHFARQEKGRVWPLDLAYWPSWAAFLLPLFLYGLTLAPTIYNLDSAELTTAAATGGLIRATGYPVYLILGGLWSHLPVGDVGFRLNLMSALAGAFTLLLSERILCHLNISAWARLAALGLLATAPYFWTLSLIAEVYTLHTALMAGVILALLAWREKPTPWRLALAVGLMAVSLGNHLATVLLIPGAVLFVLMVGGKEVLRPRTLIPLSLALLLGLSLYLYLPWRYGTNPTFNYAGTYDAEGVFHPVNLQTFSGFWWLVSGKAFATQMGGYTLTEFGYELGQFGQQLWRAFLGVGIGPAMLGMLVLARRDKPVALLFTLLFAANAFFYVNYRVIDKNTMFLPTYLVWALWLGVGYQAILDWVAAADGSSSRSLWLWRGAMLVAAVAAAVVTYPQVSQADDWSTRERSEDILALVEPNALLLGWWDVVPGVQYLQLVEGQRPDVLAINRFLISGDDMVQLINQAVHERPVYINNPPVELLKTMRVAPVGPIYRLFPP